MVYNNKFVFICLGKAEGWVGGCADLTELSQMFQCQLAVNSDNWDYSAPYTVQVLLHIQVLAKVGLHLKYK